MKAANVESPAEFSLRPLADGCDLELSDLVGQSLSRPGDVAIDLSGAAEIVDRLGSAPTFGMQARVDHQSPGAEELRSQGAKVLGRAAVQTQVGTLCAAARSVIARKFTI